MHRYLTRAALVVLGTAMAVGSTGCVTIQTGGSRPATSTPAPGEEGLGSGPTGQPESSASPAGGGGQSGSGKTGGGETGGGYSEGTKDPKPSGPTIVSFRIRQKPKCAQGTNINPIPGVPVILEWKVTGTDTVTLSVDGPGVYDSYPAQGSATIDFPCAGPPGDTVTHTYQLRTVGGGAVRSKTLTGSAVVYEIGEL
ncbi:hypothetical protein I0C86_20505 [Plantactinospora sp. S1510]|uniref:Lipoprotein n=1 Tax=Plantactinospora alkalitolerans TaxID=2789879 RepID=A0ABS0GYS1_9ACTN|nr:hypothetical protein [Plantactinospora alkalitolerans]MBF9131325.1 hypothetical protein [Plantactinospora alkalitolerans]